MRIKFFRSNFVYQILKLFKIILFYIKLYINSE